MKKTVFFVSLIILSLSASAAPVKTNPKATEKDNIAVPDKTENKLSEEEINRLTKRVEEIRDMDKSNLSLSEKRELKKELKGIKENIRRDAGGYIYIGGGTLLLIIILLILLL